VDWEFDLPLGSGRAQAELFSLEIEKGLTVYFIHHPGFFDRVSLYEENNRSYADNAERFIFFQNASRISRVFCRGGRKWSTSTTGRPRWFPR
jgi:glycogen synthase